MNDKGHLIRQLTNHNLLQRPTEIVCQHDQAFIKPLQDQDLGTDWQSSPSWQDCLAWSNSSSNSSIRCLRMTSSCMSLRSIPRSQSILFRPPVPWQLTTEFDQSISPVPSLVSPSAKRHIKSAKLIPRTLSWWLYPYQDSKESTGSLAKGEQTERKFIFPAVGIFQIPRVFKELS